MPRKNITPHITWLRLADLTERYGCSPSTIWRWSKTRPAFKAIKIGPNTTVFSLQAIEEFEAQQMEIANRG
ncbi:helix-turn-helix transcriptional regulator [Candidatus Phyllobacterium onerii]|uniref:helix-turn-helix transcriptional regulator n=1 Tax=Candidatus Phyllobacterium onerii TaxID=3020828 RepID=UPI00232F929D|nr:hypothetical protein [Phyllobacterium sp. IY22]